jgi:protein-tyrosine phosphatase
MVDKNFDITWVPLTCSENKFIGVSHCPGKHSKDRGSSLQLYNDLKSLKHQKVDVIISLTSEIEIERLGIVNFRKNIENFGFIHFIEPIEDFSIPKRDRIKNVNQLIKKIISLLKSNKSVLVHCNAGLGRSGIIVALVIKLIDGFEDPVSHVRKYRVGAVETNEQKSFVTEFNFLNID